MFGLQIVEVGIGLTLIYLLLASVCSAIRERIEAAQKTRAADLECAVRELLQDPRGTGLTQQLFDHPLIFALYEGRYDPARIDPRTNRVPLGTKLPSYIPAASFARALLDITVRDPARARGELPTGGRLTAEAMQLSATRIDNAAVRRIMVAALDHAGSDVTEIQAQIETWFNSAMDRASGWYRRRTQRMLLVLSVALTVLTNANTLTLIERLSIDSPLQQALSAQSQLLASATPAPAAALACASDGAAPGAATATPAMQALRCLSQLSLPLGWTEGWPGPAGNPLLPATQRFDAGQWNGWWRFVLQPLIGLLLTAFAVTLGAPFWFDTLNRLTSLRSTLKPDEMKKVA